MSSQSAKNDSEWFDGISYEDWVGPVAANDLYPTDPF